MTIGYYVIVRAIDRRPVCFSTKWAGAGMATTPQAAIKTWRKGMREVVLDAEEAVARAEERAAAARKLANAKVRMG